jgi:PAS domain S-box-containing protein
MLARIYDSMPLPSPPLRMTGADDSLLRDNPQLLHRIVEAISEAVVVFDTTGRIVLANDACRHRFGSAPAALVSQPVALLFTEAEREKFDEFRMEYLTAPYTLHAQPGMPAQLQRKDGGTFAARVGFTPVRIARALLIIAVIRADG